MLLLHSGSSHDPKWLLDFHEQKLRDLLQLSQLSLSSLLGSILVTFYMINMCSAVLGCVQLCDPTDCSLLDSSVHGDSPGKNTGAGCHALRELSRLF